MRTIGLPGVSFGGVSRRDGWSAAGRSEYQMGIERRDGVPQDKHRNGHQVNHVRHWLLLPKGVDPSVWTREAVWEAAGASEKRQDAREGRYFDMSWPRDLPTERIEGFVDGLYSAFVEMGLAVQVDWESSPASDGEPNDHIHGLIATRTLSSTGFSSAKSRDLDVWFRAGVRKRVADLFNEIAQDCGAEVRFDPRPNSMREEALPPEDRLPRRALRNVAFPVRETMVERRDEQRRWRHEHDLLSVEITELEQSALDLRADLKAELETMSVLTSWQHEGADALPLSMEVAMTAFIGAGIAVDDRMMIEGIGAAFSIGETTLIDAGDRIFADGVLGDNAVRALRLLARRKGWRDLSLVDAFGMPIPVPAEPERQQLHVPEYRTPRSRLIHLGKHDVFAAARQVLDELKTALPDQRQAMLDRVVRWGNPRLERLTALLLTQAGDGAPTPISIATVLHMIDEAVGPGGGLWHRYALERDLIAMTVPGSVLSRPFRPHASFYQHFPMLRPDGGQFGYGSAEGGAS